MYKYFIVDGVILFPLSYHKMKKLCLGNIGIEFKNTKLNYYGSGGLGLSDTFSADGYNTRPFVSDPDQTSFLKETYSQNKDIMKNSIKNKVYKKDKISFFGFFKKYING